MEQATDLTENTILVAAPVGKDAFLIQELLQEAGIESRIAADLGSVVELLTQSSYASVILTEEAISGTQAGRMRDYLSSQPEWSDIPILLLLSHHSASQAHRGKSLIDLFAPSGNISLMERPFHPSTLVSSVQVAIRARRRQYQMRNLVVELRSSLQQRDDFMSAASHELKTPLTSLKLQTQMSIRSIANGDKGAFQESKVLRNIQNTERHVSRLTRLIDEMLDVTRIQVGKLSLNLERVDLKELVNEIIEVHRPQFRDNCCAFQCEAAQVLGTWDRYRVEQVVTNLLTNALKYGNDNPVELTLHVEKEHAVLEVRDGGPGIAKEDQARIFGRFERAVSNSNISGLGLGLYITRHIVELHQGQVTVESVIGKGSIFRVRLPLELPVTVAGTCSDPAAELGSVAVAR